MKRILVTLLMVLYMAGAMGAAIHLHYCMGKLVRVSLIQHDAHKCGKCGMVKKTTDNGCCNDVHKSFKTAEHNKVSSSFIPSGHFCVVPTLGSLYALREQQYQGRETHNFTPVHSPPNKEKQLPIYLQIRNLRI